MSGYFDSRHPTGDEVRIAWLVTEVERLQEKADRLDLFEAYWDYVDKHGEEGLV